MRRFKYYRSPAFEASHVLLFQQVFVACVSDEHFFCLFAIAWTCWWDGDAVGCKEKFSVGGFWLDDHVVVFHNHVFSQFFPGFEHVLSAVNGIVCQEGCGLLGI